VKNVDTGRMRIVSGKLLSEGLPVSIEPDNPVRLIVIDK
jgi:hypothetical protein